MKGAVLVVLAAATLLLATVSSQPSYTSSLLSRLLLVKLNCKSTETLLYKYESDSNLWGSQNQKFRTTCDVHLDCVGPAGRQYGNGALLYSATIDHLKVTPLNEPRSRTEFSSNNVDLDEIEEAKATATFSALSGFVPFSSQRKKRATPLGIQRNPPPGWKPGDPVDEDYPADDLVSIPFRFVLSEEGVIKEVLFASTDTDEEILNLKRAVASSFQTDLQQPRTGSTARKSTTDVSGEKIATFSYRKSSRGATVSKSYNSGDVLRIAGTGNVDLSGSESETFNNDGVLVRSVGSASAVFLDDDNAKKRRKRAIPVGERPEPDDNDYLLRQGDPDIGEDFRATATYSLNLQTRTKRSAEYHKTYIDNELEYFPAGIEAKHDKDSTKKKRLEYLKETTDDVFEILKTFLQTRNVDSLQSLKDAVRLENDLGLQENPSSLVTSVAQFVRNINAEECSKSWDLCQQLYTLLSFGGGRPAERLFMEAIDPVVSKFTDDQRVQLLNLLGGLEKPSDNVAFFLRRLLKMPDDNLKPQFMLNLATIASRSTISDDIKDSVASFFEEQLSLATALDDIGEVDCSEEAVDNLLDVLHSIGNLGDALFNYEDLLLNVISTGDVCPEQEAVTQAAVYALRDVSTLPVVQDWYLDLLESNYDCDTSSAVITTLIDMIYRIKEETQSKDMDAKWPLIGFNDLDEFIAAQMQNVTKDYICVLEDMYRYMTLKDSEVAVDVVNNFLEDFHVEEYFDDDDDDDDDDEDDNIEDVLYGNETHNEHKRQKRAWTHSTCSSWGHSIYYNVLQSQSAFNQDKSKYNRRRHCLAYKYIGVSKAHMKMYGGIFAGAASSNKYKLYTKMVGKGKIFSKSFDIGTVLGYRIKSSSSTTQKRYMVIAGKTLLDSKSTACDTKYWVYERNFHIPIWKIDIWVASIDIGAQIKPQFRVNFICQGSSNVVFKIQPKAILRIGASAQASLAKLVRGGITIGINLNFYIETVTESVPCIAGYYGYDPMSISIEAWYQFRTKVKIQWWPPKIKWTWGKRYKWKPSSLSWKITSSYKRSWKKRTCDRTGTLPISGQTGTIGQANPDFSQTLRRFLGSG